MSVFSAYRVSAYSRFTVSSRCACVLQFRQGVSLARPGSFPIRQLTGKRSRLVIMGITLAMLFSQAPVRIVFTAQRFLSPSAQGRNYGIILSPLFSTRLSHSQNCVLCVCGLKTRFQTVPICYIGLQSRAVWLFDTLFNRSKTNGRIFACPSHENRFPTKKALCFSLLRIGLSVSFFCFDLLVFLFVFSVLVGRCCLAFEYTAL